MKRKTKMRKGNQIKSWSDVKQYVHYLKLRIQKLFDEKTFFVRSSNICTKKDRISIGEEYQYKAGSTLERIIVEDIDFKDFFIYVKIHFIEQNRSVTCSHVLKLMGYSGMWRIWDKDHYDIEEWKADRQPIDLAALDGLPVIYV